MTRVSTTDVFLKQSATVPCTGTTRSQRTLTVNSARPCAATLNSTCQSNTPTQQTTDILSFWATVCKTVALCRGTIVCLSCLSVTLVYCGQTVGWIKMKLGTVVGLGPGHIVLDGIQLPPERGTAAPHFSAHVYCSQTVAHLSYCRALVFLTSASCLTIIERCSAKRGRPIQ